MTSFVFAVYLIITVFLLVVILWLYIRYVRPVRRLRQSLRALADHEYDARLYTRDTRSETGKIATRINQLLDQRADVVYRLAEKQKEVERTIRSLDNFAYVVSHDLKGPFNSIKSIAELLRLEYGDRFDESGKELLGFVDIKVDEMDRLLMGVLMYSRVRQDSDKVERVDLNAIVRDVVECLPAGDRVEVVVNNELPHFATEPELIRRLFQELATNAASFMNREYGRIEIGSTTEGTGYTFYVRDNGPGIDPKYFEKIFNIFYTIRENSLEVSSGKGVGLAIARKIVEFKGGQIWVESRKGFGSTFYFSLPAENPAPLFS